MDLPQAQTASVGAASQASQEQVWFSILNLMTITYLLFYVNRNRCGFLLWT